MSKNAWLFAVLVVLGFGGYAEASSTTYTVVKNDNLTSIARRFCGNAGTYRKIADDNGIADHDLIHTGSPLTIKCGNAPMANDATSKPREMSLPVTDETVTVVTPVVEIDTTPSVVILDDAPSVVDLDDAPAVVSNAYAANRSRTLTSRSVRSTPVRQRNARRTTSDVMTQRALGVISAMSEHFPGESLAHLLAIGYAESGLKLDEKGFNCYDYRWSWKRMRNVRYSRSCEPEERYGPTNWSVDCGLLQINVRGQRCPDSLYTLEGNLRAARKLYDERGFQPWTTYTKEKHKPFLARFSSIVAMVTSDGLVSTRLASMSRE